MPTICIQLKPEHVRKTWKKVEKEGCTVLFCSEAPQHLSQLFVHAPDGFNPDWISHTWEECVLPEIDWEEQWMLHAPDYRDGYVWIDLKKFGCSEHVSPIRLLPGPGFGDLSHPTTNLMLQMMVPRVKHRTIIDVGCGSGVLSLCAAALGGKSIQGIDIDLEAIAHAKKNATLNQSQQQIDFFHPHEKKVAIGMNPLILMNMIWSEQKEVLRSFPPLNPEGGDWLISGVHRNEKEEYLSFAVKLGWKLVEEFSLEDWLGFHFTADYRAHYPFSLT